MDSHGDLCNSAAVARGMSVAGTGKSISTMRVIFTRPTCQLSIALTTARSRFDPTLSLGAEAPKDRSLDPKSAVFG